MQMKTKIITALVAFFATFIFSVGLALMFTPIDQNQVVALRLSNNNRYARDISNLLRQDVQNGIDRSDSDAEYDEAESVADYAQNSAQINDENLPRDFQNAWRTHMDAWQNYADFLRDLENPKFRGNFTEKQISQMNAEHNSKINTTWYEVLRIARKYGTVIPANAY